jgi:molecular chaperone DnaK
MQLGIDLGTSFTKIGYIENNTFISLADLPTIAGYDIRNQQLYFGNWVVRLNDPEVETVKFLKIEMKRNPGLTLGGYCLEDIITGFFRYIKQIWIDPHHLKVDALNLSVPNYFGLKARRLLLNAAKKAFLIDEVRLIPEPVAALLGHSFLNPSQSLDGDILTIDIGGGTADFSFISLLPGNQILLEAQLQTGHDIFSGSELDKGIIRNIFAPALLARTGFHLPENIINHNPGSSRELFQLNRLLSLAEQFKIEISTTGYGYLDCPEIINGYSLSLSLDQKGFLYLMQPVFDRFQVYFNEYIVPKARDIGLYSDRLAVDYILLLGGASQTPGVRDFINRVCPKIPVISPPDLDHNVVAGLGVWDQPSMPLLTSIKTIYPFNFYIEKPNHAGDTAYLEKIPFDTANLALDFHGRYRILSIQEPSLFNISPDPSKTVVRVFEVSAEEEIVDRTFTGQELIIHIEEESRDIPPVFDLYLNLKESIIEVENLEQRAGYQPGEGFADSFIKGQLAAYDLINHYKYLNPDLMKVFKNRLNKVQETPQTPFEGHFETVFYKLLALLNFLSEP